MKIMNRLSILFLVVMMAILGGCHRGAKKIPLSEMPYNPLVEAFTYGDVSRFAPVYLIFNQDIPTEKMTKKSLDKSIRISPDFDGEFSFENNRTIVFRHSKAFERNKTYEVEADLSAWFDNTTDKSRRFRFTFTTLPFEASAELISLDINPKNENAYDVVLMIRTADKEQPATVEKAMGFSEKNNAVWKHDGAGRQHTLTLEGVAAGSEKSRTVTIDAEASQEGMSKKKLIEIQIPSQNEFSVYDVKYIAEPEKYIELTFTKTLDDLQDMSGLASINNNQSSTATVDGNKIRLYPDAEQSGTVSVSISKNIRAKNGLILGKDLSREVEIYNAMPAVKFIGNGVVIPVTEKLNVPFQAIYLHGVVVSVIKILQQNIGQFLQTNQIDGEGELMRVGRIVARKTIFFDDQNIDLTKWNTFGVNLKEMIEPEPGAIYHIQLSFNKDLSAYPCADTKPLSKEDIKANDALRFQEQSAKFDEGGYYYSDNDQDWNLYNYKQRNDPCTPSYYFNKNVGKNVLASNIGLMAIAGEGNEMRVLAHSLIDTNPQDGVTINAYNYQNQLLASGLTDSRGICVLNLKEGTPYYVVAAQGPQRSYLRVDKGSVLSMSSFDVSGEKIQKGIKGFIYGDRGIWRPGDTLHLAFMMNDQLNKLPDNHPVIMEISNPLGQLYSRKTETKGEMGLYVFSIPMDVDAPTGAWTVKVKVGSVAFDKRIRIETIKPNRLKIDLKMPQKPIQKGESMNAPLHVEWLQGAAAPNLKYDIQATFIPVTTVFPQFTGFVFDNPAKSFMSEESKIASGTLDASGNAILKQQFDAGASAPGMLMGSFVTRVFEESGDFSMDAIRHLYSPYARYVGISSPQKDQQQLDTNRDYTYQVAVVNPEGKPQSGVDLEVTVYKMNWYWWWNSSQNQLANFVADTYNKPVKQIELQTGVNGTASFGLNFPDSEWGPYFISVKDKQGKHSTGIVNYYDMAGYEGRRNSDGSTAPQMLKFTLDKKEYHPGEKMKITFPSSANSRAVIIIENGTKVLSVNEYECSNTFTTLSMDVTAEMQPNAYVYIALLQPHAQTINDLPIRMYGVMPFTVNSQASHLEPVINVASTLKPEKPYSVTVSEKQGKEMSYTLAVVDEGLLDLTRFKTPDPWAAFNAREALGVDTWDMYNYVVGAYGGRIEQLFSIGGDEALNRGPKAIVNRFKPVVEFRGPFILKKGEKKQHNLNMPAYNGRVRVMVVAGNGKAYGDAEKSVVVKQPVMIFGTMPRVVGVGDEMVIPATVFTTEKGIGAVNVSIHCSSNLEIIGSATQTLDLAGVEEKLIRFRVKAKDQPGVATIKLTAVGKGESSTYEAKLPLQSVAIPETRVKTISLGAGQTIKESVSFFGQPATNSLQLEAASVKPLNLDMRIGELRAYPYDCAEQLVSKAFPQLYLPQLMNLTSAQSKEIQQQVSAIIERLKLYQTVDGAFAYWPGGNNTNAWASIYGAHFLLKARDKGYDVSREKLQSLLSNLKRIAREWKKVSSPMENAEETTQAYRLYVLALANEAEVGAMNRLKEEKELTSLSKWLLAGAYAEIGQEAVARSLISATTALSRGYDASDPTFGTNLRDQAIQLLICCRLNESQAAATKASSVSEELSGAEWLNTQETAFALVAYAGFMEKYGIEKKMEFDYSLDKSTEKVSTEKPFWSKMLIENATANSTLTLTNKGKSTLFIQLMTSGIPKRGIMGASANGLVMNVNYVASNGSSINPDELKQGTNFTAVVTIKNPTPQNYKYLALTQYFPAGWEILNTRFITKADNNQPGVDYQDIRDDRVYSYIDNLPSGRQVTIRINLCAVYSGSFYMAPVSCKAMYDNHVYANSESRQVKVE